MAGSIVKCAKCKKGICFIPDGYEMGLKVECVSCHRKIPAKKTRQTLSAGYAKMRKGIRPEVHYKYSFKSATEANFARIMNFLNLEWKYEERAFTFDGYKRRPHVYIMDFEILGPKGPPPKGFEDHGLISGYYEIKGYMNPQSREKLRRLKRHYKEDFDNTTVVLYNKYKKKDIEFCEKTKYRFDFYDRLTKIYQPLIPTWE